MPGTGKTGFTLLPTAMTGILFSNTLPEFRHLTNQILLNGSGIAAGDIDGDGWCDLYFCAMNGRNALFRNTGNWRFQEVTDGAGVACPGLSSTGAAFADLDGDGDLDLIVNSVGNGTRLFLNDGQGRFAPGPILNQGKGGMSLALADVDGDGFLDIYVVNYRTSALMDMPNARATFKTVDGRQVLDTINGRSAAEPDLLDRFTVGPDGNVQENGEPDALYRNLGGTNFVTAPFTGGAFLDEEGRPLAQSPLDWGLAAQFRDINQDRLPDLYVCNDFDAPDRFWINQGSGVFRLLPRLAQRKSSRSAMAVDFADINRDGFDDFLVVDMMSREHSQRMRFLSGRTEPAVTIGQFDDRPQYEMNTLFVNRGDATFAEVAQLSGIEASEWSWACTFLDVDLDGWEDLLVANGMERAARDPDVVAYLKQMRAGRRLSDAQIFQARRMFPRLDTPNLAFRNQGDLTFAETSRAWGFNSKGISTAIALADLDNDGDLDAAVGNLNAPAAIYRNDSGQPRIAVRLKGAGANTRGIGARIEVISGALPAQSQEMICGGRYLSGDDALRAFAAGALDNRLEIEVTWRTGRRSRVTNALPNHIYEFDEAAATESSSSEGLGSPSRRDNREPAAHHLLFEDVSEQINHTHQDEVFDDFTRQPLLPNKLSQLGPGAAWFDIDDDGREDLVIGAGKGGRLAVYRNRGTNGFQRLDQEPFAGVLAGDLTCVLGWKMSTNQSLLLAGSSQYEDDQARGPAAWQYDLTARTLKELLPATASSTGPLALADVDGDGDLDLFVGGRVLPGKYPEPAASQLFLFEEGTLRPHTEANAILEKAGLVSGAVFSDLNGDGFAELVLAVEWGPIRVFRNDRGRFAPWNVPIFWPEAGSPAGPESLDELTGWWNSVTAADFDGDGRLDLAAGNWGRNSKYQGRRAQDLVLYYGDLAGNGTVQILEAWHDPVLKKTVPLHSLDTLIKSFPFLRERFQSHRAYSTASLEEAFGARLRAARTARVRWLDSTVFLNRGDRFEGRSMPVEAQMAPAFGLCGADFTGDGHEDLFLAQNFFSTRQETPRYDAGRGLLLKGDGRGGFQAMAGQQSGILVYGEQRGAAAADFNQDGRMDLVVTQNGTATRLFRNAGAPPGLRVRLAGPPANPAGVGALLRLRHAERPGPVREIHAGSGYWAQDSSVQVLCAPRPPDSITVLWPGGKTTSHALPPGATEIVIGIEGGVSVSR